MTPKTDIAPILCRKVVDVNQAHLVQLSNRQTVKAKTEGTAEILEKLSHKQPS